MRELLLLGVLLVGCANAFGPQVLPIYQYRGYGEYLPERDADVLAKGKALGVDPSSVKFLQETLPEGVVMDGTLLAVKPGYRHKLIGKLAYSNGRFEPKLALIARCKQVALAAEGDAAIGFFLVTDEKDYTRAQGVEAVIIKLDPTIAATLGSPAVPSR